jgi:hypothetical protein
MLSQLPAQRPEPQPDFLAQQANFGLLKLSGKTGRRLGGSWYFRDLGILERHDLPV